MLNRGMVSRFNKEGADGVYIFNWYSDGNTRRELLNQIGKPETLRRKDKIFAATPRYLVKAGAENTWYGAFHGDRIWGEVPVPLKRTLTGDGPHGDHRHRRRRVDRSPENSSSCACDSTSGSMAILSASSGTASSATISKRPTTRATTTNANPFASPVSDVSGAVWLRSVLDPAEATQGPHRIKVVLAERNSRVDSDMLLTHVEIAVFYD